MRDSRKPAITIDNIGERRVKSAKNPRKYTVGGCTCSAFGEEKSHHPLLSISANRSKESGGEKKNDAESKRLVIRSVYITYGRKRKKIGTERRRENAIPCDDVCSSFSFSYTPFSFFSFHFFFELYAVLLLLLLFVLLRPSFRLGV